MSNDKDPSGAELAAQKRAALEEKAAEGDREAVRELRLTRLSEMAPGFYGDRDADGGKLAEGEGS